MIEIGASIKDGYGDLPPRVFEISLDENNNQVCEGGKHTVSKRLIVVAYNEGGFSCTWVDLLAIIDWVKLHKPELLK